MSTELTKIQPISYRIQWTDSYFQHGWKDSDELDFKAIVNESVGYLVKETDEAVWLAQSRSLDRDGKDWGEVLCIPRCAIYEITAMVDLVEVETAVGVQHES